MRDSVDVSIIIVNWNRLDDVLRNLHYLAHQRGPRTEVVVIDNGSTDGSAERLSRIGWIRLIRLSDQHRAGRSEEPWNRSARGKYIVFLDSDAVLPKSGLAKLVSRMESDPTIGIIGCRIVNSQTRKTDVVDSCAARGEPRVPRVRHLLVLGGWRDRAHPGTARSGSVLGRALHLQ